MKYLAAVSGSSYIQERETISGPHDSNKLKEFIMEYNKYLIFCAKCGIPETIPSLTGNKKNPKLEFCCSACKNTTEAKAVNKRIDKGIDIIIKYLKAGGEWKIHKGTCVKQSKNTVDTDIINEQSEVANDEIQSDNLVQTTLEEELNPFDFI
jgi:hypothetical protein